MTWSERSTGIIIYMLAYKVKTQIFTEERPSFIIGFTNSWSSIWLWHKFADCWYSLASCGCSEPPYSGFSCSWLLLASPRLFCCSTMEPTSLIDQMKGHEISIDQTLLGLSTLKRTAGWLVSWKLIILDVTPSTTRTLASPGGLSTTLTSLNINKNLLNECMHVQYN